MLFGEVSVSGIFLPMMLVIGFIALLLTSLSSRMLVNLNLYQYFSCRPLVEVSLFIIWLGLLLWLISLLGEGL